ncbi:MAG: LruC domain-containing protein [Prevotella sp.]
MYRNHFKVMMASMSAIVIMGSCTKGENVYDEQAYYKNQSQQYSKSWEETFGPIDEKQDWNMATQVKSTITVSSGSTVYVYSGNPYLNEGVLLATFTNSGSYTFDAPKGSALYFMAKDANGKSDVRTMAYNESGTYNVDFTGNGTTRSIGVRSGSRTAVEFSNVDKGSYVATGLWSSDRNNEWGGDGKNPEMQYDYQKPTTMYNRWHDKYYDVSNGAQGNSVEIDASLIDAIKTIIPENQKSDYYSTIIQDVDLIVTESGPITLTFAYGQTSNSAAIGYYIYTDKSVNNTMPEEEQLTRKWLEENGYTSSGNTHTIEWNTTSDPQKLADKFVLIPNMQNIVYSSVHTEMKLLYPVGNGVYSETFPAGTKISFFVIPNAYCENGYINAKYTAFSFADMNYDVHRSFNNGYYSGFDASTYATSHAATFKVKDKIVIGFEDAPAYNSQDFDYNDCVFILDGNFKDEIIPDPIPEEDTPDQWIVACEDLGSTDDYDFNDIVFSVNHLPGSTTMQVTPKAAGGIYAANIYFDGKNLGEIHQLLGYSAGSNGLYPMINTGAGHTGTANPIEITVPADFSLASGMSKFSITVEGQGTAVTITSPKVGTAPQMLLLEGTWRWPKEKEPIQSAYPQFANWSSDANNIDWVNSADSSKLW